MFRREKLKGVEGIVEIENPNRVVQKSKKVRDIDLDSAVVLSRKERYATNSKSDQLYNNNITNVVSHWLGI